MAKTVIAFSSTPSHRGNSDILAEHILQGAAESGASVEKVRLHGLTISPCTACSACQVSVEEPCVINDDVLALLEKVRAADCLVFASPIYFASVNAQMKAFLDRFISLFGDNDFTTLQGKQVALAFAYGAPDPLDSGVINAIRMFQDACRFLGMHLKGVVHAVAHEAGAVDKLPGVLADAVALGRKLVQS